MMFYRELEIPKDCESVASSQWPYCNNKEEETSSTKYGTFRVSVSAVCSSLCIFHRKHQRFWTFDSVDRDEPECS